MSKQAYKFELPTKCQIYDVLHVLLLEQDIIRKRQVNKSLGREPELNTGKDREYKIKAIKDSAVYAEVAKGQLLGLYYLIFCKGYSEDESISEPAQAVLHLWKMINIFHNNHPGKPITTSPPLDSVLLMAKLKVKQTPSKNVVDPLKQLSGLRKTKSESFVFTRNEGVTCYVARIPPTRGGGNKESII